MKNWELYRVAAHASLQRKEHEESCTDYMCIMKDGCAVMEILRWAENTALESVGEAERAKT